MSYTNGDILKANWFKDLVNGDAKLYFKSDIQSRIDHINLRFINGTLSTQASLVYQDGQSFDLDFTVDSIPKSVVTPIQDVIFFILKLIIFNQFYSFSHFYFLDQLF